ncbi:MAG: hypothetical protein HY236_03600 [Acidobacteria bacterium]|nr:hypothetical protein [Acidobacteriota bacterium]
MGKTKIMHVNPDGVRTEIASIDLKKILNGQVKDLELIAGDIIYVPSSQLRTYLELTSKGVATSGAYIILARY